MTEKILCVDDDPNILDAYRRQLRKEFHIETAGAVREALAAMESNGPYAVIVSDMRMPGMDGIQFLARAKEIAPDTVRIMLTGNADQETAVEAINEGNIFRFLTKPCPSERLGRALQAGIEQYRLVMAEKELLEKTLRGAIKVLTDLLCLVNPTAFGRASRVDRLVRQLAAELDVEVAWELDVAAMLSQIGCVTLPPRTLDRLHLGEPLGPEELKMFEMHPSVGRDLVAKIPRLEGVAEIIAYQEKGFDGSGVPADSRRGREIPLGARILKVALDFDTFRSGGLTEEAAVASLFRQPERYDPDVLNALQGIAEKSECHIVREIGLRELTDGMIFAGDVRTTTGMLLVCKGQEATQSLCQRLLNYSKHAPIREPIRVLVRMSQVSAERKAVSLCAASRR
jgi:response regulator RpfG family c-di-GMP phosphodiesterase